MTDLNSFLLIPAGLIASSIVLGILLAISSRRSAAKIMALWFAMPFALLAVYALTVLLFGPPIDKPGEAAVFMLMLGFAIGAIPWGLSCALGFAIALVLRRFVGASDPAPECATMQGAKAQAPAPSLPASDGWQALHVGFAGDGLMLDGLSVWELDWEEERGSSVTLPHPAHPSQRHVFGIFTIRRGSRCVTFAAAELSNGVWGFYRRSPQPS